VYRDGELVDYYDKRLLPTYDVFDEDRYFTPGRRAVVFEAGGKRIGLAICEDLWKGEDAGFAWRYRTSEDPVAALGELGVDVLVSPSASPFVLGKGRRHHELVSRHARRLGAHVLSVNQLGGNDDLVFDGHSLIYSPDGKLRRTGGLFGRGLEDGLLVCDFERATPAPADDPVVALDDMELLFRALVLGVRDYLRKTGFERALVALSGGIDSALTAAIACAAIGGERVTGVSLPGMYSSDHSMVDATELASNLGMPCLSVPIREGENALAGMLNPALAELGQKPLGEELPDVAEENLQSRVRGVVMMALSNRTGAILLTTGNKSELAVGYCTLYGDMNGGLAVLSDVPKTLVFELSRWINEHHERLGFETPPIPQRTIDKPPSAELRPDQKDTDSLPEYHILDEIIERHVEGRQSAAEIIEATGIDAAVVERIARLIRINEYKRQQLAIGIKVTGVAFGQGRRMPIAQGWG
ncbi:MAG: NAD+ synthase, partial [Phycisphaerales bacterium JB059]